MALSPSLAWLKSLKSTQLKSLASAIGTTSSGSKPALISQIQLQLQHGLLAEHRDMGPPMVGADSEMKEHDIISIDMGIRNLAFCHISLPAAWSTSPLPLRGIAGQIPSVKRWTRFAVASLESELPVQHSGKPSGNDSISIDQGSINTVTIQEPVSPPKTDAYDPKTLSTQAYLLICRILGLPPSRPEPQGLHESAFPAAALSPSTHILIERQRFRSMGGSAVQEWTLRVNMLESMLYAVLRTLQETGLWRGKIHAVMPSQVARYWLDEEALETLGGGGEGAAEAAEEIGPDDNNGTRNPKKTSSRKRSKSATSSTSLSARTKTAKIRLVEQWLEAALPAHENDNGGSPTASPASPLFAMDGQALRTGSEYLRRRKGGGRKRQTRQSEDVDPLRGVEPAAGLGKLDDLADCLLQGMAWVKWEEKRRQVLSTGEAAM